MRWQSARCWGRRDGALPGRGRANVPGAIGGGPKAGVGRPRRPRRRGLTGEPPLFHLRRPTTAHMGYVAINAHATNDDSGSVMVITASAGTGALNDWTVGDWLFDVLIQPSSVTTDAIYVGLLDNGSADSNAGSNFIGIRYDTDRSNTTFVPQICDASGAAGCAAAGDDTNSKTAALATGPATNTWARLRIYQVQNGVGGARTIYMRHNDGTAKSFCASGCDDTLATAPGNSTPTLYFGIAFLTRAATNPVDMKVDYWRLTASGLTRY